MFNKLFKENSGATSIEYTLIVALIAVVLITAFNAVSKKFFPPHEKQPVAIEEQQTPTPLKQ